MKGRICYTRKSHLPGLEKLRDYVRFKSSFLKPVTSKPTNRVPFFERAVVGSLVRSTSKSSNSRPATVIFFVVLSMLRGRSRFLESLTRVRRRAGHRFSLCVSHCAQWPVQLRVSFSQETYTCRPLFFPASYIFYSVAGLCVGFGWRFSSTGPAVLRRYRDIH